MNNGILWWGYRHTDGSLHVKRYFDQMDIEEAQDSVFVERTYGPFDAMNREDALQHLKEVL